jgi:hypothetical protein
VIGKLKGVLGIARGKEASDDDEKELLIAIRECGPQGASLGHVEFF